MAEDKRVSAREAGYMELANATKGGDCAKVKISGGISLSLGCCNLFEPESKHTQTFKCGACEYKKL